MAETHTVSWHPTKAHKKMRDKTTEALVLFTVDENGIILTMDGFLDPAFVAAGPRAIPHPGSTEIERYTDGPSSDMNKMAIVKLFDCIANGEDMWPFFDEKATATQFMASTKGRRVKLALTLKKGKMINTIKGQAVYTNRRQYAGEDFAIEIHTVSLQGMNPKAPDRRHKLEVAVLLRFDPDTRKVVILVERS